MDDYAGTPVWEWDGRLRGYRGRLPTPEEDFEPVAVEGWDLI